MIIQARMSSKRFPGKVMRRILNMPMIYRIYERVILWEIRRCYCCNSFVEIR